ncbi:unnamed protein product [Amaranthus hypochondriacus]
MGSRFDKVVDMEPSEVTQHAKGVLESRTDESRFCHATATGGGKFEILKPRDFVSPFYKGAAYKLTYEDHIHPMADPTEWPSLDVPEIAPLLGKRNAGKTPKQRRRAAQVAKKGKRHKINKCSLCKELGHNAKTCKAKKESANTAEQQASSSQPGKTRGKKRKTTN